MTLDNILEKRIASRSIRICSHFLFWMVLFGSSYFLIKVSYDPYRSTPLSYISPLRQTVGLIAVFYPLMYLLVPRFLVKRRWLLFTLYLTLLTIFYIFLDALGEKMAFYFCESCQAMAEEKNPDFLSVIQKPLIDNVLFKASNYELVLSLFSGLVLPIGIKVGLGYNHFYTKNLELEKEKVRLELNFLKAQVNPHFLFNTLNNLYGLIIHKRTDDSAETVTRLSEFMRYSLENADKKRIFLSEEIKLIENYIELEKLRMNHTLVSFETNANDSNKSIPPLLFIPLIENAFKYNTDKTDTNIRIGLHLQDDVVHFRVQNVFDENKARTVNGGLGLSNLMKRMDLYFTNKYEYDVQIENSIYKVYLQIDLT